MTALRPWVVVWLFVPFFLKAQSYHRNPVFSTKLTSSSQMASTISNSKLFWHRKQCNTQAELNFQKLDSDRQPQSQLVVAVLRCFQNFLFQEDIHLMLIQDEVLRVCMTHHFFLSSSELFYMYVGCFFLFPTVRKRRLAYSFVAVTTIVSPIEKRGTYIKINFTACVYWSDWNLETIRLVIFT